MNPEKLLEAARDLGASDGRILLEMGIYSAVQVAKEALQRLANIEEVKLPAYFSTVADAHERDRHMSGIPSQMGRETAEKLIRAHKHRGELLDGIKAWMADAQEAEEKAKALVAELGSWGLANQEIAALKGKVEKLEAGIAAYRKRSAEADSEFTRCDFDDADAWEASLIDVDGQPMQNS